MASQHKSALDKLLIIVRWFATNAGYSTRTLRRQDAAKRLDLIEQMLDVQLPNDIRGLYALFDGEEGECGGSFLGHGLMSIEQILDNAQIALSFREPPEGTCIGECEFSDLLNEDNFTSTPPGAIRLTYFNPKWVPIIQDFGGNYIGVDLDPDLTGKSGQVIVFGRDEDDMFVLANDWKEFLDLLIVQIRTRPSELLGDVHLHDFLKPVVTIKDRSEHG